MSLAGLAGWATNMVVALLAAMFFGWIFRLTARLFRVGSKGQKISYWVAWSFIMLCMGAYYTQLLLAGK